MTTHGMSKTRIYRIWAAMRSRCNNPNSAGYENYGGRGIEVCSEWQTFEPFGAWANANGYNDSLTIERIDVNGGYCPENCKWIERRFQPYNTRNSVMIEYKGGTKCLKAWCDALSLPYDNIHDRISKGWDIKAALETPVVCMDGRDWSDIRRVCADRGLNFNRVKKRISSGWSEDRALSEPVRGSETVELRAKCKVAGIKYATVRDRMKRMGWTEEQALTGLVNAYMESSLRARCEKLNVNYRTVVGRIYNLGWDTDKALNTPILGVGANQTSY